MTSALAGTGALVRLALRRDRWLLSGWILLFALMTGFSASATADLYPSVQDRVAAADTINSTASLVALYGRIYDPASLGALSLIKLTAFGAALLSVLMVVIAVRHTRAEEESGRLELVAGGIVGRHAPLTAALVVGFGASVLLGLLTTGTLVAVGLPSGGSLAFGLGWAATGMAFTAVAGVTAQVSTGARVAVGLGLVAVGVTYALRAVGDLAEHGPSLLSWLSPIGWNQQVRAFAGDRWWVLLLPLALVAGLVPLAFLLRARRDLDAGLIADRPGPARGGLAGVWDLAVRLHRGVFVSWAVAFLVFGALLGSLATSVTGLVTSPQMRDIITRLGGEQALSDAFLSAELRILGTIVAAYGIAAANHLRSEETTGHAEMLLATATPRSRWATSHSLAALLGITLLLLVAGLAVGAGDAIVQHDASQVGRVVATALGQVPAAWVMAGAVVAVFGWVPRLTGAVWGVLVAFIVLGEFGVLWKAPQWLMDLSPFVHSPRLPVGSSDVVPLLLLTATAALLSAVGYVGWRRRDLSP